MRVNYYYYLSNYYILKQNGTSSNLLNTNDMILFQYSLDSSTYPKQNLSLFLNFVSFSGTAKIKLAQIIDVDVTNLTYQSIYSQYISTESNIYLCSHTINSTNDNSFVLSINKFNYDAIKSTHKTLNIILFFESCTGLCELNFSETKILSSSLYYKNICNYMPIDENNMFKFDIINGFTSFHDVVYTYHNDIIDFPITFGDMNSQTPFRSSNSFIYNFSLNFEGYIDYYYDYNSLITGIEFYDNSGICKVYQFFDNLDDETKDKIDMIKDSQNNAIRNYLHDWNMDNYGDNLAKYNENQYEINNLNIESNYYIAKNLETSSFMLDYDINLNGDVLKLLTIYDKDGIIKIYTKYKHYSIDDIILHLTRVVYPNGEIIYFENQLYPLDSEGINFNYKTKKILISNTNDVIEFTYNYSSNTIENYLIDKIDFVNQYRKIEFVNSSTLNDEGTNSYDVIEYKVIDYFDSDNLKTLKHIKIYLDNEFVVQVYNVLSNTLYSLDIEKIEDKEIIINKYSCYNENTYRKILLSSNKYIGDFDNASIVNLQTNEKTIYLFDNYYNIKEVIHHNKEQLSYTYNDYDFLTKESVAKLTNKVISNHDFNSYLKDWSSLNATFVNKQNNVSKIYLKLKAYSSFAQKLYLDVNKRYEFVGHIKPLALNTNAVFYITGGYNTFNGENLEWHNIYVSHNIDVSKNSWYYFNTDSFYIPNDAVDIDVYLVVETGNDIFVDYLGLFSDYGENFVQNYKFDNLLESWEYSILPDIYENPESGYYVRVDPNGFLSQTFPLMPGDTYILRGFIKIQNPSLDSTSTVKLKVSYFIDEEIIEESAITLNQNVNGWYEFMCNPLVIPINATQIEGEILLSSSDVIFVKEFNISSDNINYSNLISNGVFQNGQQDISIDPNYSNSKFIVSDNNIIIESSDTSIDKSNVYGTNVLKIYGEKHNSYQPRTVYKEILVNGNKGDLLSANVLVKYIESSNDKLIFFVKLYDDENNFEEYKVYPTSDFKYYQLLTNHIIAKSDYNKIVIGIKYTGLDDVLITGFELYKNYNTSTYSYDELLNVVSKDETFIIYDEYGKPKKVVDNRGRASLFNYSCGNLVKAKDMYGNVYENVYQNNRKVLESYHFANDENIQDRYTYDENLDSSDLLRVTHRDHLNNETSYLYDYLLRNSKIIFPNDHVITNTYNNFDKITKVESSEGILYRNILNYFNESNNLKNIIPSNETNISDDVAYQYIYDNYNRISEIKFYDNILYKYTYNSDDLIDTMQINDDLYKYTYDNYRRVIEVKYSKFESEPNFIPFKEIIYDKFNNIMYIKDNINHSIIHFEYDINNRINKVSKLYTNEIIKYTYDDYNNIKTKKFDDNAKVNEINYYTKIDNKEIKEKYSMSELINEYNIEIINASLFSEGMFGISRRIGLLVDTQYDSDINKKIISFQSNDNYLTYDLKTWNKDKFLKLDNGMSKKLKYMQSDFDYNKTFSFWIKPRDAFSLTSLMSIEIVDYFGNQTDDDVRLCINNNGNVMLKNNDTTLIVSDNSLIINEWNFISLSFIKDSAEDIVTYKLCVNDTIKSVLAPLSFSIMYMQTMEIAKEKANSSRTMCFDIAIITIDSHNHDDTSLIRLRDYTEEFVMGKNETQMGLELSVNTIKYNYMFEFDSYGKITGNKFYSDNVEKYSKHYNYNKTQIISENSDKVSYTYTYDNMGNIATRTIKDVLLDKIYDINIYTYDLLGRLIKKVREFYNYEDSPTITTMIYEYDSNGNILNIKTYNSLTLDNNNLKLEYVYQYDNIFKDKLKAVNKIINRTNEQIFMNIEYEINSLYPSKINDECLEWSKGRLIRFGNNAYEYNIFGQRVKKITASFIHEYVYENNMLIKELITNASGVQEVLLEYIYDQQNTLVGVVENTNVYYYDRDITGEIRGIVDSNGNYVVKYYYSPFGIVTKDVIVVNNITSFNPYLYKGYYYDIETQLFYCNSRYYSPELCRFISPDSIEYLDPQSINGLNLYCYCMNNPIMYADPSGHSPTAWWEWALAGVAVAGLIVGSIFTCGTLAGAVLAGAAIGAGISLGTQAFSGELNWGQFALDTGVGAITGLIGGSGVSRRVATLLGGVVGAGSNFASQLITGTELEDISVMQILAAGAIGAISGFIGGAGARNKAAINQGKGVQAATKQLNKVVRRIANGYRYNATTAQVAFTNAMNGLTNAISSQMGRMLATAMISYGVSTVAFAGIDAGFDNLGWWFF